MNARKPNLSNLRVYGCKAFTLIKDGNNHHKLDAKADIGRLVGYEGNHLYYIWVLVLQKVIKTRDVRFDEEQVFDGTHPINAPLTVRLPHLRLEAPPSFPDTTQSMLQEMERLGYMEDLEH